MRLHSSRVRHGVNGIGEESAPRHRTCRQSGRDGKLQDLPVREEAMTEPADVARGPRNRGPKNRGDDVVDEARGLVLAALLAALAGTVDAIGYLHLSGLFISFMSGNSTQLAAALGQGDLVEVGTIAELIALFVLGAAAGQILAGFTGKRRMTWVLVGVAVLLAIAAMLAAPP